MILSRLIILSKWKIIIAKIEKFKKSANLISPLEVKSFQQVFKYPQQTLALLIYANIY